MNATLLLLIICGQGTSSPDFFDEIRMVGGKIVFDMPSGKMPSNIVEIDFRSAKIDDSWLAKLKELPNLRTLSLDSELITVKGLKLLSTHKKISSLLLGPKCNISGEAISQLAQLEDLRDLSLGGKVTEGDFKEIAKIKNLKVLRARGGVTDASLAILRQLSHLEVLDLQGTNVSDAGLVQLGACTNLRVLRIDRTRVSGLGLVSLQKCPLEVLGLAETELTDEGAKNLRMLKKLKHLYLQHTVISDDALKSIAKFDELQFLNLSGCDKITGRGLNNLVHLPRLVTINISGCDGIDDKGFFQLAEIQSLKNIWIQGTKVSPEIVGKMRKDRPDLKIEYSRE